MKRALSPDKRSTWTAAHLSWTRSFRSIFSEGKSAVPNLFDLDVRPRPVFSRTPPVHCRTQGTGERQPHHPQHCAVASYKCFLDSLAPARVPLSGRPTWIAGLRFPRVRKKTRAVASADG